MYSECIMCYHTVRGLQLQPCITMKVRCLFLLKPEGPLLHKVHVLYASSMTHCVTLGISCFGNTG